MADITESGFYLDVRGQPFLVTQGLVGYTLVDKKKILFRIFLHPIFLSRVTAVAVKIKYIGTGLPDTTILVPISDLLIENSIPNGPSAGIIFQGSVFPDASIRDYVQFNVLGENLLNLATLVIPSLKFQRSGRLRPLVKSLFGNSPWGNKIEPNIGWFIEIGESMNRIASMLPVSDDIAIQSNPDPDIGLSWTGGQAFDIWPNPCPSGNPPSIPDPEFPNVLRCPRDEITSALVAEAKQLRSQGFRVDVTVAWRPRDYNKFPPPGGEGMGGQGMKVQGDRLATIVGGSINNVYFTASIMAQEVGHTFGLEPRDSPHYDGGSHSKDDQLIDPFAFDFVNLRPYFPLPPGASFLEDVMFPFLSQGMNSVLYNAFDWEHLRQELVRISTLQSVRRKKLGEVIKEPFKKVEKIQLEHPESTLYSKKGFEWHWTDTGFKLLERKQRTRKSGLAYSAQGLLSALKELGVKEIYAPVDVKPLTILINTMTRVTCYNNGIQSSGLP